MSRAIDADALIDGYKHMGYDPSEHPEESYMEGWCKGFNSAVDHCVHHAIHAPTIEPERKTGKWISKGYGEYRCSSCRNIIDLDEEVLMSIKNFDYCPYCGSAMQKGEEG